ncbi:MAG: hypothetical protein MZU79_02480 [Anaerotruncus sp.]|nr:hypothetical protein [Anaerotruncus sp.]
MSDHVVHPGPDRSSSSVIPFLRTDEMVLFTDSVKIESLMREALARKVEVAAVPARSGNPEILSFVDIRPPSVCFLAGEKLDVKFKTSDLLFISYQIGYATYNFETMISRIFARRPDARLPLPEGHVLFRKSGRRSGSTRPGT